MTLKDAQFLVGLAYRAIEPAPDTTDDPYRIVENGQALCMGYALVVAKMLDLIGEPWELWNVSATRPPESHVLVVASVDGWPVILDGTLGVVFPHSIEELRSHPELADQYVKHDTRWRMRGYIDFLSPLWRNIDKAWRVR